MKVKLLDVVSQELKDLLEQELMDYVSKKNNGKEVSSVDITRDTIEFNYELYEDIDLEERQIETKHGTFYLVKGCKKGTFRLLDSDKKVFFYDCDRDYIDKQIEVMNKYDSFAEYLEFTYDEVCWGKSKEDCLNFALNYIEDRAHYWGHTNKEVEAEKDACKKAFEHCYNRVGDTYVLFEYASFY